MLKGSSISIASSSALLSLPYRGKETRVLLSSRLPLGELCLSIPQLRWPPGSNGVEALRYVEDGAKGKHYRTVLTCQQKAELLRALDRHQGRQEGLGSVGLG